ncbi:hypothetical protein RABR111495_12655 [Rahnella bruchi]|jgi:hypothetical protein
MVQSPIINKSSTAINTLLLMAINVNSLKFFFLKLNNIHPSIFSRSHTADNILNSLSF